MDVLRKYKVKLRPPSRELPKTNTTVEPSNTSGIPLQIPPLLARLTFPASENSTQNSTQVTSIPVYPALALQQPVTTSTYKYTNTGSVQTDSSTDLESSLGNHWMDGSTASAHAQGSLADFDNIWNDYIELGPNLNMSFWNNLFSDLGPGTA